MVNVSDLEKFEDVLVELDTQFEKMTNSLNSRYDKNAMDEYRMKKLNDVNRSITNLFTAWNNFKFSEKFDRAHNQKEIGESRKFRGRFLKESSSSLWKSYEMIKNAFGAEKLCQFLAEELYSENPSKFKDIVEFDYDSSDNPWEDYEYTKESSDIDSLCDTFAKSLSEETLKNNLLFIDTKYELGVFDEKFYDKR